MSEPTWTTMHIGGALPADKIEELIDRIHEDFVQEVQEAPESDDEIRAVVSKGKSLFLQANVNCGNPDAVIAFCIDNNLTYWLHYDAGYEWDSGIQIWVPGASAVPEECPASAQGYTPVVDLATMRIWAKQGLTLQHVIDETARFESEKVPPLTIVEMAKTEDAIGAEQP
jgi:hypothetical protein